MIIEFESYIKEKKLCNKKEKILITVSGGADSVVLLHLFIEAGYTITLAHCNFNLRGKESDEDEKFVNDLCDKYKITNHFISFNTQEYATKNKVSIEMAARELRYNWFNKLCEQHNYSKIATGHHLNDSIETIFINLARGTGVNGINGISPKNGNIIRPLLPFTRTQIEEFASTHSLLYRNDSSNESLVYMRNIIRHEIIPSLKKINPSFETTMKQNLDNISGAASIFNNQIQVAQKKIISSSNGTIKISIEKLLELKQINTYLFEFITPYGFNINTVKNILLSIKKEPGRLFYSDTHKILIDRDFIIIEEKIGDSSNILIKNLDEFYSLPFNIEALEQNIEDYTLIKTNNVACLDADKVHFPLILRKWEDGDTFYPLGMNNRKKLSDFFIDQKIDRFQKNKTWILECNGDIIWIVGIRIDNRFKITDNTQKALQLTLL